MTDNEQDITPEVLGALAGYEMSLDDVNTLKRQANKIDGNINDVIAIALKIYLGRLRDPNFSVWSGDEDSDIDEDEKECRLLQALTYTGLTDDTLLELGHIKGGVMSNVATAIKDYVAIQGYVDDDQSDDEEEV